MSAARLMDRVVLRLTGPDTASFLQGLVTANVERLAVGETTHTALLTPQGKVASAFFVWRTDEGVLLDALAKGAAALAQKLRLYKLRAKVEIEAAEELSVHVGEAGDGLPDPRLPSLGARWLSAGDAPPDEGAYEARRLSACVPELGTDHGPGEVFPMDVNLDRLGAVDYRKGCFVGQEVASRMYRKGEVRRRSWAVRAEGALSPGDAIKASGSTLGTVTSARGGIGIALLRVDRVAAAGGEATCGEVPVALSAPSYLAE